MDPELLREWEACVKAAGIELRAQFPASIGAGQLLVAEGGCMLTRVPRDHAGGPFSPAVPVVSVVYPPLVAITDGPASPALVETLRLQGAVAVLSHPLSPDTIGQQLDLNSLVQSASWLTGMLENVPLDQALERAELTRFMLVISCPHRKGLSPVPWSPRLRECQDTVPCSGWLARVYVSDGVVVHAEAPGATGDAALAKIARLDKGSFRFFPMFIPPAAPVACGTVEEVVAGLRVRNQPTQRPPPPPPSTDTVLDTVLDGAPTAPPPVGLEGQTPSETFAISDIEVTVSQANRISPQTDLERTVTMDSVKSALSAATGLKCAARADPNGVVMEVSGQIDAEQLCAIVAMSNTPLEQVAETLGLGRLQRWASSTPTVTLYVNLDASGFVAVTGEPNKAPDAVLTKINAKLQGK